jgi:hypothetical protein
LVEPVSHREPHNLRPATCTHVHHRLHHPPSIRPLCSSLDAQLDGIAESLMSQQYSWGSHQRRGLPPISTQVTAATAAAAAAASNSNPRNPSSGSPSSRHPFSPASQANSSLPPSSRHNGSRASSVSSTSSPFSPSQGAQQSAASSFRARTIPPSSNPQAPSAAAAASQGGVASSSGGGGLRLARASPSLSQSSDIGSPLSTATPTSAPFHSSVSLINAQVSVLLVKLHQEKDKTKRETAEEQVLKASSNPLALSTSGLANTNRSWSASTAWTFSPDSFASSSPKMPRRSSIAPLQAQRRDHIPRW